MLEQEVELFKMVEGGIPYPMVSDPGGKIGTLYGVYDKGKGVDVRGRFLDRSVEYCVIASLSYAKRRVWDT